MLICRVLGPTEVTADGEPVDLGGLRPRRLITALAAAAGQPVTFDRLTEAVWGADPPPRSMASLQSYVSRLRRAFGARHRDALARTGNGYRLSAATDVAEFEVAVERGRALRRDRRPADAVHAFDVASALWRGEPFADLDKAAAEAARVRLVELYADATEERLAAVLDLGDPHAAVAELVSAVRAEPYRERRWELLIVGLYRCARQTDALAALREVRARLTDDLGVDPGPALQDLERRVLAQDPTLLLPTPPTPPGPAPAVGDGAAFARMAPSGRPLATSAERLSTVAGPTDSAPVAEPSAPNEPAPATRDDWSSWGRGDDLPAVAWRLAMDVGEQESAVRQRLLADTGDVRPADISYARMESGMRWRTDGGDRVGSLDTVGEYFRGLTRGRMVVLGEPGAGKTVLVIELLLELLRSAVPRTGHWYHRPVPVPVRLSLPTFDSDAAEPTAGASGRRLDDWIAGQLVSGYGVASRHAHRLVTEGWILPVLDGLDEMDPDESDLSRARMVMRMLNQHRGPHLRPVVVTCRTRRYELLAQVDTDGARDAVQDATVVVLQPLTVERITAWLTHRFPDARRAGDLEERWRPIVAHIRARPTGPLARCLASPLRLYLAVTAYQDPDSTPEELRSIATDDLDEHLFARLIPAVTAHHPRPDGGTYSPAEVRTWLTSLASHLRSMAASGRSGTDLYLHDLWRVHGSLPSPRNPGRAVRYWVAAGYAAVPASLLPLAGHNVAETADAAPSSWFSWIGLGAGLAFSVGTARSALRAEPDVRQLDLASLRTAEGRRRLLGWTIAGLVVGAALGVTVYLLFALPAAPGAGGLLGLLTGLVAGLMSGLGAAPVTAGRPSETFARGTAYDLATMLIVGTAFGFTVGPWFGPAFGVAFGLACAALRRAGSPWPRYALAAWLNARAGFMPPRPAPFLDWAYHAGLVRLSGAAVQFRHHDLQLWLLATMADGDLISTPGAGGRPCASSSADR